MSKTSKKITPGEQTALLDTLEKRFAKNMARHKGMSWEKVLERIQKSPVKLWSLHQMESTGGEPDVIGYDKKTGEYIFADCSAESPKDRRSVCYDEDARESRKEHKPKASALGMAAEMGIEIMDEEQYRALQELGKFDTKTSSWIKTPKDIREKGGAVFCDWRYGHVFLYHNGADSYYGARGFRGLLKV